MMEPQLGCDPQTDHLLPKNVYPIFEEQLRAEQRKSVEDTLKKVEDEQRSLVNIINGLISQNFRDIKQTIDFVQRREALCDTVAKVHEDLNRETLEQYMKLRQDIVQVRQLKAVGQQNSQALIYSADAGEQDDPMRGVVITAAPELRFSRKDNVPTSENEAALRKIIQDLQDAARRTRQNLEA